MCTSSWTDGTEYTIWFTPPAITAPASCTLDGSNVWTSWLDFPATYVPDAFTASINMFDTQSGKMPIEITLIEQSSAVSGLTFNANFMLPDGQSTSFPVVIDFVTNNACNLVAPTAGDFEASISFTVGGTSNTHDE